MQQGKQRYIITMMVVYMLQKRLGFVARSGQFCSKFLKNLVNVHSQFFETSATPMSIINSCEVTFVMYKFLTNTYTFICVYKR